MKKYILLIFAAIISLSATAQKQKIIFDCDLGGDIDDAFANRLRDRAADEHGPSELEDGGDDDRATQCEGARANRCAHRVGHIVGTDVPGHVEARDGRYGQDDRGHLHC